MTPTSPRAQFTFERNGGGRSVSMRYTKEPYLMSDMETTPLTSDRTKEPYLNSDMDTAPLTSDMTVDSVDTEVTDLYIHHRTSTMSTVGPGWRSNMQGDYNAGDTAPVSSKDLLCWAYQVN